MEYCDIQYAAECTIHCYSKPDIFTEIGVRLTNVTALSLYSLHLSMCVWHHDTFFDGIHHSDQHRML